MKTEKVIVEKWNPNWELEFKKIVDSFGQELLKRVLKIEHIGSTVVYGLSSKPCIDMDIVINDYSDFEYVKFLLECNGYIHDGNLEIKGREAFAYKNKNNLMVHHLYVCTKDSEELKRHVEFRNYLRDNPDAIRKYSKIKEEGAKLYTYDRDKYIEYKSSFIEYIYVLCELSN
ncbi:MAG: GrpB family protein [Peptoniphilaceae bacterium]